MPINIPTSPAVFWWRPACWLRVSGADAASFLQGQLTNDLRGLERAPAVYGLWLTVKGKVLADSFVLRAGDEAFWVGSYFSPASVIRERLESYVIADDVVIEDVTPTWAGVAVFGARADDLLRATAQHGTVFPGRRTRHTHAEWVFPAERAAEVRNHFVDTPEVDAAALARLRIEAAIPAIPMDIGPADLPNEGALETEAISYTKGCYLGQEVMARLKSMGQVRRRLLRVRGSGGALPTCPARLFVGSRDVGELRSVARTDGEGWLGLAMLSLLHVQPGTAISLAADGSADIHVVDGP